MFVRPRPQIGQHFLNDLTLAKDIVNSLRLKESYDILLEIGAGTGVLTQFLIKESKPQIIAFEIDKRSIDYLEQHFDFKNHRLEGQDFLKYDLNNFEQAIGIIGNFPYQISASIFFKILQHVNIIREVVCMVQKEVALRLVAKEGSRTRGLLSVLLQTYYNVELLKIVLPECFCPPPKVDSAVIRFSRNDRTHLPFSDNIFQKIVKMSFLHRRKKLKNNLKPYLLKLTTSKDVELLNKRAESLSVEDFIYICEKIGRSVI